MNNEIEIKDKYLPIGTVVLLKGGKKELMIVGYCIIPTAGEMYGKEGKIKVDGLKIFDYGAYFYPEGVSGHNDIFTFNHDQIEKVCHMGYETENQKEITRDLNKRVEEILEKAKEIKEANDKKEQNDNALDDKKDNQN